MRENRNEEKSEGSWKTAETRPGNHQKINKPSRTINPKAASGKQFVSRLRVRSSETQNASKTTEAAALKTSAVCVWMPPPRPCIAPLLCAEAIDGVDVSLTAPVGSTLEETDSPSNTCTCGRPNCGTAETEVMDEKMHSRAVA